MSAVIGKTSGSPAANGATPESPPQAGRVAKGLIAVKDTLGSAASTAGAKAVEWKASGASLLYKVVVVPASWVWEKLVGGVNWLLGRSRGEKAEIVTEIERRGWTGKWMERVNLTTALANRDITPAEALVKHGKDGCDQNYLDTRGHGNVNFSYTWFGMTYQYNGRLLSALRRGYISIDEAIDQKMITEAQARDGGFLKPDAPAKTTK